MDASETVIHPEWLKVPVQSRMIFVGRHYLCVGAGRHLLVHSVATGQQHIFTAIRERGDGIRCYAGHRQLPVLAFAEKCLSPKIIIISCPEFNEITTLGGGYENIVALSFSIHEYLVSYTNLPCCKITVWNWRTQERLVSECSGTSSPLKQLSCSIHSPVSVVQLQVSHCSELLVWDIHYIYKRCLLVKHVVTLPQERTAVGATWNIDGALFVLDDKGCIYELNSDYGLDRIMEGSGIGNEEPCFAWYNAGLVVMDTNLEIKHFAHKSGKLTNDWSIPPVKLMQLISNPSKETLIGWSAKGLVLELDNENHVFTKKANYGCNYVDICFINPTQEYLVTLSADDKIAVWYSQNVEKIGKMRFFEKVTAMASNPTYPYVAFGLASGELKLISLSEPNFPKCFTKFCLSHKAITHIQFNEAGDAIVAANLYIGLFFIIKGIPGTQMQIVNNVYYGKHIADFCIREDKIFYKLHMLVAKENKCNAGKEVLEKMIPKNKGKISKCKYNSTKMFTNLIIKNDIFYAKDILTRSISTVEFAKRTMLVTGNIKSGHLMRCITLEADKHHIYTYGYDGIVIIRSLDLKNVLAVVAPHHRSDGGVRKAIVDHLMRYVVTLGRDGTIVCSKVKEIDKVMDRQRKENEKKLFNMKPMFHKETIGYIPEGIYEGKTFLEMKTILKIEEEARECVDIRRQLKDEFQSLKREVINLLEANLNGPETERIDIIEFYLHKRLKEYKEKEVLKECNRVVEYSHALIQAQNKVWQWMKEKCSDTMTVKRSIIYGIFSNFYVENYSSYPADEQREFKYKCAEMERDFEEMLATGNVLKLWIPMSQSELQKILQETPHSIVADDTERIMQALARESRKATGRMSTFGRILEYPASDAGDFSQICQFAYREEEIHTYGQIHFTKTMLHINSREMREYLNNSYADIMELKCREVDSIKENNARLRFILSEMNMSSAHILDPEWVADEMPDSIIEVKDEEVGILPYVSPSEQRLLDEKAAEEERIRLLLLADNFRERALERMMHGVLEVRWEDTLKRDIPLPKCMKEKSPEDYNAEDLLVISEYEKEVEFLESERLRYRGMLEHEYEQVSDRIRETVRRFNRSLMDLLHLKIRVEIARLEETLAFKRMQVYCRNRILYIEQEKLIKADIKTNEDTLQKVQLKLCEIQETVNDCVLANEQLLGKEKQLEKNFRKDIQDCSSAAQEVAIKLYKKKPKTHIRNIHCASLLVELAGCLVSEDKSKKYLTPECIEYLRSVQNLDLSSGIPSIIDESVFNIICRHRRLRLENDLLIKGNNLEQAEIEISIQTYQNILSNYKEKENKLKTDLENIRKKKLEILHNKQLQVVMKQGMVEVPLRGLLSDFDDVIVVRRAEVETVNEAIRKAGERKLAAMQKKMVHRRSVMIKEWEHEKMRMEIENLEEDLHIIDSVKMTKEMQTYLNQVSRGESSGKGVLTLEQEIHITKESYEREILNRRKEIVALEKRKKYLSEKNKELDIEIAAINVDICELAAKLRPDLVRQNKEEIEKRMMLLMNRSKLVKEIQDRHNEILILQAELELLRLKTYPALKFKTLS